MDKLKFNFLAVGVVLLLSCIHGIAAAEERAIDIQVPSRQELVESSHFYIKPETRVNLPGTSGEISYSAVCNDDVESLENRPSAGCGNLEIQSVEFSGISGQFLAVGFVRMDVTAHYRYTDDAGQSWKTVSSEPKSVVIYRVAANPIQVSPDMIRQELTWDNNSANNFTPAVTVNGGYLGEKRLQYRWVVKHLTEVHGNGHKLCDGTCYLVNDLNRADPTFTFLVKGAYRLWLEVADPSIFPFVRDLNSDPRLTSPTEAVFDVYVNDPVNNPPEVWAALTNSVELFLPETSYRTDQAGARDDGERRSLTFSWKCNNEQGYGDPRVNFDDAAQLHTTVHFPGEGRWVLGLTASDGEKSSEAYVRITVTALTPSPSPSPVYPDPIPTPTPSPLNPGPIPMNQPPEISNNFPETTVLEWPTMSLLLDKILVVDDGLPFQRLTYRWNSDSPLVSFDNAGVLRATARFNSTGEFILRLLVDDGERTTQDLVRVQVVPRVIDTANAAPAVFAGSDATFYLGADPFYLSQARVHDDGKPVGGSLSQEWRCDKDGVVFDDRFAVRTSVRFPKSGVYTLTLRATDGELHAEAGFTVTVQDGNRAPNVAAKAVDPVSLNETVLLSARAEDDGIPYPVSYRWSVESSPRGLDSDCYIWNVSAPETYARFMSPGEYQLRITASDGLLSDSIIVRVTVIYPQQAPVLSGEILPGTVNRIQPGRSVEAQINMGLTEQGYVRARVVNRYGDTLRVISEGQSTPGVQKLTWDGTDNQGRRVPSGVYTIVVEKDNQVIKKIGVPVAR